MSRCLADRAIDHVLLERGEVAHTWRTERWDSLRLLTPNWQSRLPGLRYSGDDPDGYRTLPEVVDFIAGYAKAIAAPVRTAYDGHRGAAPTRAGTACAPTAATGTAAPSCWRPARATSRACRPLRRACRPRSRR